jgi:probable F420-dependent oxidoreductase
MTRVAGEVADGMLVHGFTTERYLRQVTIPMIEAGLTSSGRNRSDFQLSYPAFVITGDTEEQVAAADAATRKEIAFCGSTPAYRRVLELHGWGELQTELHTLSKRGEWDEMDRLITDEIIEAFAVRGQPEDIPAQLQQRFGGIIDRISLFMPHSTHDIAARILAGLKSH